MLTLCWLCPRACCTLRTRASGSTVLFGAWLRNQIHEKVLILEATQLIRKYKLKRIYKKGILLYVSRHIVGKQWEQIILTPFRSPLAPCPRPRSSRYPNSVMDLQMNLERTELLYLYVCKNCAFPFIQFFFYAYQQSFIVFFQDTQNISPVYSQIVRLFCCSCKWDPSCIWFFLTLLFVSRKKLMLVY